MWATRAVTCVPGRDHRASRSTKARAVAIATSVLLQTIIALAVLLANAPGASAYAPHPQIRIVGDGAFTPANGVTRGAGTPTDPYVIEGWDLNASTWHGIDVRNTNASFLIQGNYIHSGGVGFSGIFLAYVSNGSVVSNTIRENWHGIDIEKSSTVRIAGNHLSDNGDAIYVAGSADSIVATNRVSSSRGYGIEITYSDNVTIAANVLSNDASGIVLGRSTNVTLRANNLTSEGVYIDDQSWPGSIQYFNSHTITPDNLVNGKPLYYHKNCNGLSVDSLPVGELIVVNCTDVHVANLDIMDTDIGIEMAFVTDATVSANRLTKNNMGVWIRSSVDVVLSDCNATQNEHGFWLEYMTGVTLVGNNLSRNDEGMFFSASESLALFRNRVFSNARSGIDLDGVKNVQLVANVAVDNEWGVYENGEGANISLIANDVSGNRIGGMDFGSTTKITVTGNRVASNRNYGIIVGYGADTVITDNTIANNGNGIYLYGRPMGPTGVRVHHNRMTDNRPQGFDDQGPENVWDDGYPSGGNWWSDYGGVDNCSGPNQNVCPNADGIGDTPYVLDADSRDRYPLMSPPPPQNVPPVAVATVSPRPQGDLGTTFSFDGTASWDAEGPIAAYRWEFGDGTNASGSTAMHRYFARGSFNVTLRVSDAGGLIDTAGLGIRILNRPPIANAGPDKTAGGGAAVSLDGTRSSDPDGDRLTHSWLQIEGPSVILAGPNTPGPTFTPKQGGVYGFELTVADGFGGSARDTVTIVVEAQGTAGEPVAIPVLAWSVVIMALILALLAVTFWRRRRGRDET